MNLNIMENLKMNKQDIILIINRDDVLFSKPLSSFLEKNHHLVKHIYTTSFLVSGSTKTKYIKASLRIVSFSYLIKYLIRLIFGKIVTLLPVSKQFKSLYSIKHLSNFHNIQLTSVKNINTKEFKAKLLGNNINIVLSNTSQIYSKDLLNIPNIKFYNFHPSLLPLNKGRFPIFWAIINGDKQGITCHEINEKIDDGRIILQKEIDIKKVKTVEEVMDIILKQMAVFMDESLHKILNGDIDYIQAKCKSFYGPIPTKVDIHTYYKIIN